MDEQQFLGLVLRVESGEATDGERRSLETAAAASPDRQAQWEELRANLALARDLAGLAGALGPRSPQEVPAWRQEELRAAVRREFPQPSRRSSAGFLGFSWRHPAWLAASATVLIFFAGVWLHHERSTRVELAIFGDLTTRGGSTDIASSLGDNNGAAVLRFDRESAYEAWLNASLWRSKAKIWIDEEHSLLRLKHRDPQSGQIIEVTENLPADPAARPAAIRKLVEQLK